MPDGILYCAAQERGRQLAERWRGDVPLFACVLAHTDTCLLPGVSAAGVSDELRAYTAAADGEVIALGEPRCLPALPSHPSGVPGPAGITRAAVRLAGMPVTLYAAGLRVWPQTCYTELPCQPGGRIDQGHAVPQAAELFARGRALGRDLAGRSRYVVLGESVPGGTTTALALLLALGFAAEGRVSGSLGGNGHAVKTRLARAALAAAGLRPGEGRADPLGAVAHLGDPMQPLAAGLIAGLADADTDVLLAGGSQMVAVAALLAALEGPSALARAAIGTTRWVVMDPAADVVGLTAEVAPGLPLLAVDLSFAQARHRPLRVYEEFVVKEGVGAGGACIGALLATGATIAQLTAAIDDGYEQSALSSRRRARAERAARADDPKPIADSR